MRGPSRGRHHRFPSRKRVVNRYGNSYLIYVPLIKDYIVIGPHWIGVIVTLFLISGGTSMNIKLLYKHKDFSSAIRTWFLLFISVAYFFTHCFLLLTALCDPGIVFRTPSPPKAKVRFSSHTTRSDSSLDALSFGVNTDIEMANDDYEPSDISYSDRYANIPTSVEGADVEEWDLSVMHYCTVCDIHQPEHMKIHHCSDCNYCIAGMDHHCPWMGQCIGKKNMRWFLLFNLCWVIFFSEFIYMAIVS